MPYSVSARVRVTPRNVRASDFPGQTLYYNVSFLSETFLRYGDRARVRGGDGRVYSAEVLHSKYTNRLAESFTHRETF